jgi:putative ABC transport system permease protein
VNLLSIAARNPRRNALRTSLTIAGAAIAVLAFIMIRTVVSAWYVGIDNAAKDRLATRDKVSIIMSLPKKYVDTVRAVPGVTRACYASWFGGRDPRFPNEFFATIAIENECLQVFDEVLVTPDERAAYLADKKGAIIGDVLARKLGVKVGDTLTIAGSIYPGDWPFTIRGIYKAAKKSVDRSQFLFHWDYMNDSIPERQRDQVGWIASRIDQPSRAVAVSAQIDRIFDEKDTQTVTMSERAMNLSFIGALSAILTALDIVSAIILIIMLMILGNTIAMGVRERTREYGVLRALGFMPKHIAIFILGEALTVGVVAGAVGVAISYPIVEKGMGGFLEENLGQFFPYFSVSPVTAAIAFGLTVLLAVASALLPALRASRLPVTDALRRVA